MEETGGKVERQRRGYDAANAAVARLQRAQAPMTPLNFELWFQAENYPQSALAVELVRLEAEAAPLTESVSHELASRYLPTHRFVREARQGGEQLARELDGAARTMAAGHVNHERISRTLAEGAQALQNAADPATAARLTTKLSHAADAARLEAERLSGQLAAASAEVQRLREHMKSAQLEALTDGLTSLPNRRAFDEALAQACAAGDGVSVALIDIDHFKLFNDRWGHATGDQVLQFVAAMIGRASPAPRLAARYGGEEFAIIFPGATAVAAVRELNAMQGQVRGRVLTRRSTGEDLGAVSVSIGLADQRSGESPSELVGRADEALYRSKRDGRDRLTLAQPQRKVA